MWFKSMQVYQINPAWQMTRQELITLLSEQAFQPCGKLDNFSMGWVPPVEGGELIHAVQDQWLLRLQYETRLLPQTVVMQVLKARVAELSEQQGFKPGRKQVKELKEQVTDELMAKAFTVLRGVNVWLDRKHGWLAVDSASRTKADDVLKLLIRAQPGSFPVGALKTKLMPTDCMTNWLAADEAPANFTIDRDAVLESAGEGRATVRIKNQALEGEAVATMLAGKKCTQLAMTWDDKVSFVLDGGLTIKRIAPHDVLNESSAQIADQQERFDADFMIMADVFNRLLISVTEALGGTLEVPAEAIVHDLAQDNSDPGATLPLAASTCMGEAEGEDPLYAQAVTLVHTHQRASISLIQRYLHIGYNRAARLMEAMEECGVVSAMQANGERTILALGGEAA